MPLIRTFRVRRLQEVEVSVAGHTGGYYVDALCADDNACLTVFGPCTWVSKDLCSLCRDRITHSATLEAEIEEATHA
jgi:hypothetical protein